MAITVVCPSCTTRITIGDDRSGTTFNCPRCSAAINVPVILSTASAPRSPLPIPATTPASRPPLPIPELVHEQKRDTRKSLAESLSPQRKRQVGRRLILLGCVGLGCCIIAAVLVLIALNRGREGRQPGNERPQADYVVRTDPIPALTPVATPKESKPERLEPRPERPEPKKPVSPPPTSAKPDIPTAPTPAVVLGPPAIAPPPHPANIQGGMTTVVIPPPQPVNPPAIEIAPPPSIPTAKLVAKSSFKSDRPAKEVFAGYYLRTPAKFKVFVSRLVYENSDEAEGEPLRLIDEELTRIAELFPEANLKALRTVPIWVEWDHVIPKSVPAFACYYFEGTGAKLSVDGVDPRKAGCVCVLSLKKALELRKDGNRQNVLLHELAHAVHDKAFGLKNPVIKNAYEQAVARRLYMKAKHDDGKERVAYANTNAAEYFAELTCAYLDRLDYFPHDAKELKEHDSVGYELMTKAYGTPEQIAAAKKKTAKKNTEKK